MEEPNAASMTAQESAPAAAPSNEAAPPTETPPSAGQTDTASVAVEQPATQQQLPLDYKALYEKDVAFKQFVEGRAGDIAKRLSDKLQKQLEKQRLAKAAEDPVEALSYAQERKQAIEAEDTVAGKWQAVTDSIQATARENPDWGKDYDEVIEANRKEADKIFATDPEKFERWVDKKIYELTVKREVEKALKEKVPTLVEAAALDKTARALKDVPRLPDGTSGGGTRFTLEQIAAMDPATYKANEEAIDRQFGIRKVPFR